MSALPQPSAQDVQIALGLMCSQIDTLRKALSHIPDGDFAVMLRGTVTGEYFTIFGADQDEVDELCRRINNIAGRVRAQP